MENWTAPALACRESWSNLLLSCPALLPCIQNLSYTILQDNSSQYKSNTIVLLKANVRANFQLSLSVSRSEAEPPFYINHWTHRSPRRYWSPSRSNACIMPLNQACFYKFSSQLLSLQEAIWLGLQKHYKLQLSWNRIKLQWKVSQPFESHLSVRKEQLESRRGEETLLFFVTPQSQRSNCQGKAARHPYVQRALSNTVICNGSLFLILSNAKCGNTGSSAACFCFQCFLSENKIKASRQPACSYSASTNTLLALLQFSERIGIFSPRTRALPNVQWSYAST